MGIGVAIYHLKEKLGYRDFSKMASAIGVSSGVLNRLKEVNDKEDMKQENIEVLEKISNFSGMTINELINYEVIESEDKDIEIKNINESCDDVGVLIDELKQKSKQKDIKIDGVLMSEDSKKIFTDSLDITRELTKRKL